MKEYLDDIKISPVSALLAVVITAFGFVCAFLVLLLYLQDQRTDRFSADDDRLYRIETRFTVPGGDVIRSARVPLPLADVLQRAPQVEAVGFAYRFFSDIQTADRRVPRVELFAVSPEFLGLINPFQQAITPPRENEIYITPEFNRRYLGFETPVGKAVQLAGKGMFIIKGVVQPQPASSLAMQAMVAFSPSLMEEYYARRGDWYSTQVYTFARMQTRAPPDDGLLREIVRRHAPPLPGAPFTPSQFIHLSARPIDAMHYDGGYADEIATVISRPLLYTLYGAGAFVLVTTLINFFNLNGILHAAKRKGLYIRRALGAADSQLLRDSLASLLPQLLSIVIVSALLLLWLTAASQQVAALLLTQPWTAIAAAFGLVTVVLVAIVLCSHLSYFFLFVLCRGGAVNRYETVVAWYTNRVTLMLQLFVSGVIIAAWAGVVAQYHYVRTADFGYRVNGLLTFELNEAVAATGALTRLKEALRREVGSDDIALSSWRPFDMSRSSLTVRHGRQQRQQAFTATAALYANRHFADVWGLETLGGSGALTASQAPDVLHVIATRAFARQMDFATWDEVLSAPFYAEIDDKPFTLRVQRVVDDFYLGDLGAEPQPLLLFITDDRQQYGALRVDSEDQMRRAKQVLAKQMLSPDGMQTVAELHAAHFHDGRLIQHIIRLVALLSLSLMLLSAVIIGQSESRRLAKTLAIMEALGGSTYTGFVYFLKQNGVPLALSLAAAGVAGWALLNRWLAQYERVTSLCYVWAFAALLALALGVVAVMTLTLVADGARHRRHGFG
ncbi:darobactin export ABC transporter permease subunit [Sodalis praecaptivus]|uniref:darobactin export ABC transporter permease subunit n=1 Tax=Sodalis praecaptivus TaxID=1239307 RepID=UPI0031F9D8E1